MYKRVNGERVEMTPEEQEQWQQESDANWEKSQSEQYMFRRKEEYPSPEEQLDMMFKDVQTLGALSKLGKWYKTIKRVKEKYPKPQ